MSKNKNLDITETFAFAIASQQHNNNAVAQKLYNQILEKDSKHTGSLNNLAMIHKSQGDYQKAINLYEKVIEIDPKHSSSHNNLGGIKLILKEYQKAKDCYKKAIEIDPNYGQAHYNLGVTYNIFEEYHKAKDCYKKAIEIDPNNANAYNNLGTILNKTGEYNATRFHSIIEEAISHFEKAIEIDPKHPDARSNLGNMLKKIKEYNKAKDCYEKAIEIDPNNANAHNNLGTLFDEIGNYEEAITHFEKAIAINPNLAEAYNNLGKRFINQLEYQKAISCYEKAIEIKPNYTIAQANMSQCYIHQLDNFNKAISSSYKALKMYRDTFNFHNQNIAIFRLKHDVAQAKYLSSKNYKINGLDKFQKIGDEILSRKENKDNVSRKILLTPNEVDDLLPFYKAEHIYKPKKISGSSINPNKDWQKVEDEYLNGSNQIMYIDDFLSDEAVQELYEFSLVSKVWNKEYKNKYLGAYSDSGYISTIHLQIAVDLKQKLPKLFGPYTVGKFWGFKYDTTLGQGINIHADFAIHNLNFWITPDEFNNNKKSGGLKVYDAPAPDHWTFNDYNNNAAKANKFLKDRNANCTNIPYKFNRAVLFNSAYFHETDEIDFQDKYEGRRINNTYLFGSRLVKN